MIYFILFRIVFIVNMPKVLNHFKVLLNALIMSYNCFFKFFNFSLIQYLLAILMLLKAKTKKTVNQSTNQLNQNQNT